MRNIIVQTAPPTGLHILTNYQKEIKKPPTPVCRAVFYYARYKLEYHVFVFFSADFPFLVFVDQWLFLGN